MKQEPSTLEIKREGNTGKQFVTEDRLVQFGQELTDSITNTMQEMPKNLKTYVDQNVSKSSYKQTFVCYGCGEGHTRKTCPLSRDKKEIKSTSRSTFDNRSQTKDKVREKRTRPTPSEGNKTSLN